MIVGILGLFLLFAGQSSLAATNSNIWNNASNDCPDINIANYSTNTGYGNPCWTGTNITANPGETINVRVYYHNTSNTTATNTRIKVIAPTGSSTSHSYTAQILSNIGGDLYSSPVAVTIPTSQTVTFGSTRWYPNQTQTQAGFLNGQNGSEVLNSNGLYIGDIVPGWGTQGSVVVSFHVSNTQPASCTIDNFNANPTSITSGSSSTLSWNTTNCNNVSINQGVGSVSVDGSRSVSPTSTTTYTLTANGSSGSAQTRTVTVNVNGGNSSCVINNFIANPGTINSGGSSSLAWYTSGCSTLKLYNGNTLINTYYGMAGNQAVYPTQTTTYTLKGYNINGSLSDTKTTTVTVNQIVQSCTINNFTANPTSITSGASSLLSWSTSNCNNVTISNLNYNVPTSGSQTVWPTTTTTYTLTANGSSGSTQTRTVTVNVNQVVSNCTINSFTANPTSITSGSSSTLSWNTTNCNSASISDGLRTHNVSISGSESVHPIQTTTYTLTARGANGVIKTKTVTVNVTQQASCTINNFTANPTSINSGSSSLLSWNTTNCTNTTITSIGNVPVDGSQTVWPTTTTTYTLTATGSYGGVQTKTVTVNVITNQAMTGSLYPASLVCTIQNGASSCPISFSWTTQNPIAISAVTHNGMTVATGNNVSNRTFNISYGPQSYYLYNSGIELDKEIVVASCGANASWNGSKCATSVLNNCKINYFQSNPEEINAGQSSTLSWQTENCNSVNISGIGSVALSGTKSVNPTNTTIYTLNATGTNLHPVTAITKVVVNNNNSSCTINNFEASSYLISQGQSSTISWNTSGCSNVNISNLNYNVPTSGSQVVSPTTTTTYVLTASSSYGYPQTRNLTINVGTSHNDSCEIVNFEASDTSISEGDFSRLIWDTNNCDRVKITSLGDVDDSGSEKVYPTSDKTYTLTAYNTNGGNQTETVRIYVDEDNDNNNGSCQIDSFTSNNTYISQNDEVTLRWRTTGCDDVSLSSVGNVDDDGSETVRPYQSMTYTLRARGDGDTDSESIYINVGFSQTYNSSVVTTVATNISQTGAQLNGLITSSSYTNANTYFEYGTDVGLGLRTASRPTSGNSNFSESVTNLNPNTIYYFRAVSEGSSAGVSRGAIEVFRTLNYQNTYNNNNNYNNNTTTRIIREVVQGTTVYGSASPIVLRIENKYQLVGVGDVIEYTVFYKNISSSILTNPMVQVIVPQGLTITNSSKGTFSQEGRTLSAPIEDLNPNQEGVIYLEARVDSLEPNLAQIVTTAILVYTNPNGAQENAMAYVLNNPKINNLLGASAFFGGMFGMSLIGWLLLIIFIMLLILLARTFYSRRNIVVNNHQ